MHPKNRYRTPYDLARLGARVPELRTHIVSTPDGHPTIDFADATAVRLLNKALLLRDFGLQHWDLPDGALCPGVPGRLDYVHTLSDLLGGTSQRFTGLDIGTGASVIYPILGVRTYGWRFVATDISQEAVRAAEGIVRFNPVLAGKVEIRLQANPPAIFRGVVRPTDWFDFTMCNPPFFASAQEVAASAKTKWRKLGRTPAQQLNFGGAAHELWTPGGEEAFLDRMIRESESFKAQVGWFTTLVSKSAYLARAKQVLAKARPKEVRVLDMDTGSKKQRVLAWRWGD